MIVHLLRLVMFLITSVSASLLLLLLHSLMIYEVFSFLMFFPAQHIMKQATLCCNGKYNFENQTNFPNNFFSDTFPFSVEVRTHVCNLFWCQNAVYMFWKL